MRFFCLILLCCSLNYASDESDYKSSVIILKDGRMIAIRGEMEIIGDEVQFMYANGELMILPLEKIDLDATREKQATIAEKAEKEAAKPLPQDQTLYDEIKDYQEDRRAKGQPVKPAKQGRVFEKKETPKRVIDFNSGNLSDIDQEAVTEKVTEMVDAFKNAEAKTKWILGGLVVFLLLTSLISFITRIGLIWSARNVSGFWVFMLGLTTAAPFLNAFFAMAIPNESIVFILLAFLLAALVLLDPLIYLIYILVHCPGKRILLIFLFFGPFFVAIALVIAFLALNFPLAP